MRADNQLGGPRSHTWTVARMVPGRCPIAPKWGYSGCREQLILVYTT